MLDIQTTVSVPDGGTLLLGLGVQAFTIGLLGELLLFFQARDVRDYRVAEIHEATDPALPEPIE